MNNMNDLKRATILAMTQSQKICVICRTAADCRSVREAILEGLVNVRIEHNTQNFVVGGCIDERGKISNQFTVTFSLLDFPEALNGRAYDKVLVSPLVQREMSISDNIHRLITEKLL